MRVIQLTVLAYLVGFVTDVFDDGASASMDGPHPGHHVAAEQPRCHSPDRARALAGRCAPRRPWDTPGDRQRGMTPTSAGTGSRGRRADRGPRQRRQATPTDAARSPRADTSTMIDQAEPRVTLAPAPSCTW